MAVIELTINDREVQSEVAPRTHLGDFLRDGQHLTGTHLGCEHGVCGACTVLLDDAPVRSCITFTVSCDRQRVRTIEGFDGDDLMRRLRAAFSSHHALQCGFCTPGMLISARDIVQRFPDADEARIRLELSGNLCRCTGYVGIVGAIRAVIDDLKANPLQGIAAPAMPEATPSAAMRAEAVFETFDAREAQSEVAAVAASEVSASTASAPERTGWTAIDDSFVVPFPLAQVWAFMGDLPSVVTCLPGAELLEHEGEKVRGKIAVKFGPMSAVFAGAAKLERDAAAHRAVMCGAGQDNISRSRANGDVTYALNEEAGGAQTHVAVTLEYMLQGPLAQFSRSGLVKDFVRRMIADFGVRVGAQLGGTPAAADALAAPPSFNAGQVVWSVIRARIARWFGRGKRAD